LDLGFREDLEFILDATPVERRTLLFSATLPREIETLAGRYQRDAVRIQTVRRNEPHADIDYVAHRVSPQDIEHAVVNVLRFNEARAALVFCSTREAVNRYSARLIERGFQAVALSGEFTQHERTRALQSLRDGRARVLVATDVAARGLDLPDLALVIHAELPHDAETLLHRSGRTGRAGRKGQCVLIVPYNRRRKADALIAGARLKVTWSPAPTPDDIRTRDHERFVADASFTNAASDEELNRARALQSARTADEIALALVRLHEVRLPAPEDLMIDTGPPAREWRPRDNYPDAPRFRRDGHAPRGGRDNREPAYRPDAAGPRHPAPRSGMRPGHHRDAGRAMVWFRINIGRERNADPRWLLPLICRAGGVTKSEIGAIRIEDTDSRFEIAAEFADQFDHTFRTNKKKEGHIVRLDAGGASEAPEGAVTAALSGTTNGVGSVVPDTVTPVGATGPDARETSRERPKRAPDETGKKRIKARWRDQGKPDRAKSKGKAKSAADGWAPRRRDDKVAAKAPRPSGRSQGHGDTGTRPATKLHKKKQRSGATAKS
ncbi:MAG: DEAD/DEAH box helicase, partial [Hyphomicrobiaceae bacterium]|nr:DEAD/DEAH box helicase [Hyphomicrobiaceae bacterium]